LTIATIGRVFKPFEDDDQKGEPVEGLYLRRPSHARGQGPYAIGSLHVGRPTVHSRRDA